MKKMITFLSSKLHCWDRIIPIWLFSFVLFIVGQQLSYEKLTMNWLRNMRNWLSGSLGLFTFLDCWHICWLSFKWLHEPMTISQLWEIGFQDHFTFLDCWQHFRFVNLHEAMTRNWLSGSLYFSWLDCWQHFRSYEKLTWLSGSLYFSWLLVNILDLLIKDHFNWGTAF